MKRREEEEYNDGVFVRYVIGEEIMGELEVVEN